jgi:hypothetical protein
VRRRWNRRLQESTMTTQTWNSDGYVRNARFVTDLGIPVLELLVARLGEHILISRDHR